MTVRRAEVSDVDTVRRIAAAAYAHYTPRIGRPAAPVHTDYAALAGHTWVLTDGPAVLGYVVLLDAADHLLVDNIAVDPAAQGRGAGARLLAHAEAEARRRGHREIRLYTNEAMTENLAYYPRRGYTETHRATEHGFRRVHFARHLS